MGSRCSESLCLQTKTTSERDSGLISLPQLFGRECTASRFYSCQMNICAKYVKVRDSHQHFYWKDYSMKRTLLTCALLFVSFTPACSRADSEQKNSLAKPAEPQAASKGDARELEAEFAKIAAEA